MGKVIKIREVGDPVLYLNSGEVDIRNINNEILDIIEDMISSLEFTNGFGIAAPQIGVNKRIIVIKVDKEKCVYEDCEDIPLTIMINPTWRNIDEIKNIEYEGCLSVPKIRGQVERYKNIEVTYYNEQGEKIKMNAHGFIARDIQHECDHLDGKVFLSKVIENGFATKETIDRYELRNKLV